MIPQNHAFGTIGGHATHCLSGLRQQNTTRATVQVSMTYALSYEDLVAVLYVLLTGGMQLTDLAEDALAHELVMDTLLNASPSVEQAQVEIGEGGLNAERAEALTHARDRVAQLYGLPTTAPARRTRARAKAAV
ncbi:hypothetical protein [Crossiella sp. CA198]|uniref:hypothetical protein n=1 Tax=Crossiella sp. CA198 TaxID=3455607 RepID=UPI003F8D574B